MLDGKHIILGVSGSIAAYKAVYLLRLLTEAGGSVSPVMTRGAERFVAPLTFSALSGNRTITSLWAPAEEGQIGHVELAHQADLIVLAPTTADLLARLATGRADDPICAIALSSQAPKLLAPAMEDGMWHNPLTQGHVTQLREHGYQLIAPESGSLASGRTGRGRMAEPETIFEAICTALSPKDLHGQRILVTAGPTREHIDPARFISNPSTGKMGIAIARQAARRGAEVTLVLGPTHLTPPSEVRTIHIASTQEMLDACEVRLEQCDILVMAAAPADFSPAHPSIEKVKKQNCDDKLTLSRTPDILKTLGAGARGKFVVGFAAETQHLVDYARDKLARKDLDLVVANDVSRPDAGFASDTNAVTLVTSAATRELELAPKSVIANAILDEVVLQLQSREAEQA